MDLENERNIGNIGNIGKELPRAVVTQQGYRCLTYEQ